MVRGGGGRGDHEVRRDELAKIAVKAAMLVEDAHGTRAAANESGMALGHVLRHLRADLTALADAVAVFTRGE